MGLVVSPGICTKHSSIVLLIREDGKCIASNRKRTYGSTFQCTRRSGNKYRTSAIACMEYLLSNSLGKSFKSNDRSFWSSFFQKSIFCRGARILSDNSLQLLKHVWHGGKVRLSRFAPRMSTASMIPALNKATIKCIRAFYPCLVRTSVPLLLDSLGDLHTIQWRYAMLTVVPALNCPSLICLLCIRWFWSFCPYHRALVDTLLQLILSNHLVSERAFEI